MKVIILATLILFKLEAFAQSNTFPSTGFVGIGVISPGWPLTVNGAVTVSGGNSQIIHLRPDAGHPGYVYWAESGIAERGILGFNAGSGDLTYRSGSYNFSTGTERFRITADGKIGIGTASPRVTLDISGKQVLQNALSTNDYANVAQHSGQLRILNGMGSHGTKALEIALLDNGTGLIQANEQYVGYNNLLLNPVSGSVGIGTVDPKGYKLAVGGSFIAESVKVKQMLSWPDYVFAPTYHLPSLEVVEKQIQENGHLSEIPSAHEVSNYGFDLGEMDARLLKKIEELTLYLIEQGKQISRLQTKLAQQEQEINTIKNKT